MYLFIVQLLIECMDVIILKKLMLEIWIFIYSICTNSIRSIEKVRCIKHFLNNLQQQQIHSTLQWHRHYFHCGPLCQLKHYDLLKVWLYLRNPQLQQSVQECCNHKRKQYISYPRIDLELYSWQMSILSKIILSINNWLVTISV